MEGGTLDGLGNDFLAFGIWLPTLLSGATPSSGMQCGKEGGVSIFLSSRDLFRPCFEFVLSIK